MKPSGNNYTQTEIAEIKEINELCLAIGHVVVQWGFVEHNLNLCLGWVYFAYEGKKIAKRKKIEKFQRRQIDFMRDCFNNPHLHSLAHFKDEGISLLDRTATLVNDRDDIIHSTYGGLYKGSFDFIKFDFNNPQILYIKKVKRTINSILETRKKIEVLAADIGHFGLRLAGK
jgi:hypothetical protein